MILIAVALFAALAYAVTQSTRSGGGNSSREEASLGASSTSQYMASVEMAVQRMMISNGCTIEQISFANAIVGGWDNSNAPADKHAMFLILRAVALFRNAFPQNTPIRVQQIGPEQPLHPLSIF